MLSYQHSYHAGNHADMLKHAVLARIIGRLKAKDKPFSYIDTHAGSGVYRLDDERLAKTGEAEGGLERILGAESVPEGLEDWISLLRDRAENLEYPGSPEQVRRLSRPGDRLELMELHPAEYENLRQRMSGDARVHVHKRDGFAGLLALSPPDPRRGLCLMDPSYELAEDWVKPAEAIAAAGRRWPVGILALWYPVVGRRESELADLRDRVAGAGIPGTLLAELHVSPPTGGAEGFGMTGSGMIVARAPWKLDEDVARILGWLRPLLAGEGGFTRQEWLVPPP